VCNAFQRPGRVEKQCYRRWHNILDPSIDRMNERTGAWILDEDSKLKDAVQTHGARNWGAITARVPSRVESQCHIRWHNVLDPSIHRVNGLRGEWT
jgi:myb proto-oncogene protein